MEAADVLRFVFPAEERERWIKKLQSAPWLLDRLEVLTACGPYPNDKYGYVRDRLRHLRARRAAWEAYLDAARACGVLTADALARLRSVREDDYRGAVAECLTCWFFAGKLRWSVTPAPPGRGRHVLEMIVHAPTGSFHVEVKAPHSAPMAEAGPRRDDARLVGECLERANRQFAPGSANVLALVPDLSIALHQDTRELVKAFYGQEVMTWLVDTKTGRFNEPTTTTFKQDGKLLKRSKGPTAPPNFTRVSAIVCIEEVFDSRYPPPNDLLIRNRGRRDLPRLLKGVRDYFGPDNRIWRSHEVRVLHNPHASCPIDRATFAGLPQLVPEGAEMVWRFE